MELQNRYTLKQYTGQQPMTYQERLSYDNDMYIPIDSIQKLIADIKKTVKKNVYPLIFIYFIRSVMHLQGIKIEFSVTELQKIRLWSNVMRFKPNITEDEELYIGYSIGKELINYVIENYNIHPSYNSSSPT